MSTSESGQIFLELKKRSIDITGESEVIVVPDRVCFTLRAEHLDNDLTKTTPVVEEIISKIMGVARKFHIPARCVQTDNLRIQPQIEEVSSSGFMGRTRTKRVSKFFVTKSVNVILEGELMAQYSNAMQEFLQTGCLVDGERYETSHLFEHRTRARQMAIQNAVAKATALIEGLPVTLGAPIYIQEMPAPQPAPQARFRPRQTGFKAMLSSSLDIDDESIFVPGTISVPVDVRVLFELLPADAPFHAPIPATREEEIAESAVMLPVPTNQPAPAAPVVPTPAQ
ncbi:hypothetical protein PAPYR_2589 [Paratrimastix pyriformis]|uniref:DUF541 domain-containing protein n=1 Tax=Paratrimastix pyriformis TaxID=342808 RepID=A0ABQ8UTR7_9EUKA|nr:hypothetical protein PAPYR_2589 [Paratrimastix pyriformis]